MCVVQGRDVSVRTPGCGTINLGLTVDNLLLKLYSSIRIFVLMLKSVISILLCT